MEAQIGAIEGLSHLARECAVAVEPRDLVLVLVGRQLEQIGRNRLGEPTLAGRALRLCGLCAVDPPLNILQSRYIFLCPSIRTQ
jgi:hypothetical protein